MRQPFSERIYQDERHLRSAKRAIRLFSLLPYRFASGYYKRRMPKLLAGLDEEEKLFLLAYLNNVLDLQLDKKTLMSQFRIMEDMFENPSVYEIYKPVRNKNILILQAMDDTGFDQGEQKALRQTCPGAKIHIFEEGGHLTRTTQRSEYDAVLHQFLER